ncbi:MAG TPA: glycoside hydrolase family 97 N-terminal domain-containing protein, partial [Flavobacterium sp.]
AQGKKTKSYELASPAGKNKIQFQLVDSAPKYAVTHGKTQVITLSDMGFMLKSNEDFSKNLKYSK